MSEVQGRWVADLFAGDRRPGDFKFYVDGSGNRGLHIVCPCGCDDLLGVTFAPGRWTIEGADAAPTVRPSIQRLEGCRWHGFLTAGRFATA